MWLELELCSVLMTELVVRPAAVEWKHLMNIVTYSFMILSAVLNYCMRLEMGGVD